MGLSQPTIQKFYSREIPKNVREQLDVCSVPAERPGDGFTSSELEAAFDPLKTKFNPSREYNEMVIAALEHGPHTVMFTGRIVNFSVHFGKSKRQAAAKGWHWMTVRDDTGAISVKLYFARQQFPLKLGMLVSIWTPFIEQRKEKVGNIVIPDAPLGTNIFPGRESGSHLILHSAITSGCRKPLGYTAGVELAGLMTLKSFLEGGSEIADAKILVCIKSIGANKTITTNKGTSLELLIVVVFDDTADAVLKLWDGVTVTAKDWKANSTVLLITRPGFRFVYKGKGSLGITPLTMVDVDPAFADAEWLRTHSAKAHKAESTKQDFPEGTFDVDATIYGVYRILFTLADVDEWARTQPNQTFTGFLSLTILDIYLSLNSRRNMLLTSECCGVPIYCPAPTLAGTSESPTQGPNPNSDLENTSTLRTKCTHCSSPVLLALNPKVLGTLLDETGCILGSNLLWRPQAWAELFGRSVEELVNMEVRDLRLLEQRMACMRVHFVFGWSATVGRLAILGVRM